MTVAGRIRLAMATADRLWYALPESVRADLEYSDHAAFLARHILSALRGDQKALAVATAAGINTECPRATFEAMGRFSRRGK